MPSLRTVKKTSGRLDSKSAMDKIPPISRTFIYVDMLHFSAFCFNVIIPFVYLTANPAMTWQKAQLQLRTQEGDKGTPNMQETK